MKKIIFPIIMIGCLGMSTISCSDFLDPTSPSEYTPDVVYNSTAYTNSALMGVYSKLTLDKTYGCRIPLNYATNNDIEIVGADASSYAENKNRGLSNYMGTPSNTSLDCWQSTYDMIEKANLVIEGINGSRLLVSGTKEEMAMMKAYRGEALTLRAMMYFDLIKNFGDVPFKTESTNPDGSNIYPSVKNRDVIMDSLMVDLKNAANELPWANSSTTERITKGFAKGLYARMALARVGYSMRNIESENFPVKVSVTPEQKITILTEAKTQLMDVYNSKVHKLNASYKDVWGKLNRWEVDNSYYENLFEIAHGFNQSGEMGYSIGVRYYTNKKYGYGNNTNVVNTTATYFYSFDKTDVRRDATVAYWTYSNSDGTQTENFINKPLSFNISKWDQAMMSRDFVSANLNRNNKAGYGINWVVMRYSDVLLMLAEIDNELNNGPTDLAKSCLKAVRNRAFAESEKAVKVDAYVENLNDYASFFSAIVDERAWEFGGEALRKYDLIRWNLLSKKIQDARNQFKAMLNGTYTKDGETLPTELYITYDDSKELINRSAISFYSQADKPGGVVTTIKWLSGLADKDKTSYLEQSEKFSSGLTQNGFECRHLYPFSTQAVSNSNGTLVNSYGFK